MIGSKFNVGQVQMTTPMGRGWSCLYLQGCGAVGISVHSDTAFHYLFFIYTVTLVFLQLNRATIHIDNVVQACCYVVNN